VSLPLVPGHVVTRIALADAAEWATFAVLPQVQEHTSSEVRGVADLVPMIERSLSDDPGAPVLFALRQAATHELVATFGFHSISALNGSAEVTYVVRPEQWGRGVATAVCAAAVRWGFKERGWVRIQATVLEPNVASLRVLEKCGFAFEGRLRNFRKVRGEPRDYLLYATVPGTAPVDDRSAGGS
jgi:RimJ/RimL family protein N-acetyltransferase